MLKKSLLLMLFVALLAPWTAKAQETLTVCDGTASGTTPKTSVYAPVNSYYTDTQGTTVEFIIPAETEGMSDMAGGTISKVTFYTSWGSSTPASWGTPTIQLYMGVAEGTTLSSLTGPTGFTVVSTKVWDNTLAEIEVVLDDPYTYEGGNLLIGTYVQTKSGWKATNFSGINAPSGSSRYNNGSGIGTALEFLPKTTFTYEPASTGCDKPSTLVANPVTAHEATLTWTGGSGTYNLQYKKASDPDDAWVDVLTNSTLTTTTLPNLTSGTDYQARVQSVCSGETPTSGWRTVNFPTVIACPAPTDLNYTLTPGQGTKVTLSWTENGEATQWQLCLNGDEENLIAMDSNPFTYEGCTPEAAHTAKVRAYCDNIDQSTWSNSINFTPTNAYSFFVNETATGSTYYIPFYYNTGSNSFIKSQFIIPSTYVTAAQWSTIERLTFFYNSATSNYGTSNFSIYMAEVDNTTLSAMADWTTLTEVYTGTVSVANNTMTINLDNPYTYLGGNLLIGFKLNSTGTSGTSSTWVGSTNNSNGVSRYCGYSTTENTSNFLPKMKVEYSPGEEPSCYKPTDLHATLTEGNGKIATLSWTPGNDETAWQLYYSTDPTTPADDINVSLVTPVSGSPTKDIDDLTPETTYYAWVRGDCTSSSNGYSKWSKVCEFTPTNATTFTVYGTDEGTSAFIPMYGNFFDDFTKSECIIPATELTVMTDGTLKAITFYASSVDTYSSTWANTNQKVFVKEVSSTTLGGSFSGIEDATIVFDGQLSMPTTSAEGYTINFSSNFTYNGGNLLIGIYNDDDGTYNNVTWYGKSGLESGVSAYGSNSTSLGSVTYTAQQFLPRTSFTYFPNETPKPKNVHTTAIAATNATIAWEAPNSIAPTKYQYQYKAGEGEWTAMEETTELSVSISPLTASTDYTFQVRAVYDGVGESDFVQISFPTLDACAFPTNLAVALVEGEGSKATFSWHKGYDEEAWLLQIATNDAFTEGLVEITTGFDVNENVVTYHATGLTAEITNYARVKATCSPTSSSNWSDVESFIPTNYVDFHFRKTASSSVSTTPFSGSNASSNTNQSQFIIPASSLADIYGGTIRSITYYNTDATITTNWGGATFNVYMAEVEQATFSTATFIDWDGLGSPVFSGTFSLSDGMMTISFDNEYTYNGGNLLIGFKIATTGTAKSVSWKADYVSADPYRVVYQYSTNDPSRTYYQPRITFNYLPTPYKKVEEINEGTITTEAAELNWEAPTTTATITGYKYQYKLSTEEWPTAWEDLSASATSVTLEPLTAGKNYDFQLKVIYGDNESAVTTKNFWTECAVVTAFPWTEKFEGYSTGDFADPCWENQHYSGDGDPIYIYKVNTENIGENITKKLKLTDQTAGTETILRLPVMDLPGNDYQFVIDMYRNTSTYQTYPYELEGVHVYASTDGNLEGATELAYIPRHREVSNAVIPAETEDGWYTYEIPIGISGNCYIILKGVNQYVTSIYMDNFGVEQIPTCVRPSDLAKSDVTNHSATLNWTAGEGQSLWQIAYSKTEFDPNTASFDVNTVYTVEATINPFTLDKILDAESTYYIYVRGNCGTLAEPDYGPWCRKGVSLTTMVATPAPSNFTASNFASQQVDLNWTAGGGDCETSWDLYYVQSDDAPAAPVAETPATKTVFTLPTNEAPYVLNELTASKRYYIWVRANHEWNSTTYHSDWVALDGNYFETLDACPTPYDLEVNNITAVTADLSWTGSIDVDDYTVEYGEEGTYSVNETVDFSGLTPAGYSVTDPESAVLPDGWKSYNSNPGYYPHVSNKASYSYIDEFGDGNNYLLMTQNKKDADQYLYAIMPQISDIATFEFKYVYESKNYGVLSIGYVTDNTDYSTYHLLQTPTSSETIATYTLTATDIATINANNGYITFRYAGNYGNWYSVGIDDIKYKAGTYTPGPTNTVAADEEHVRLTGLTHNTTYLAKVKSNCSSAEWSYNIEFTTLPDGTIVFTNDNGDGNWGTEDNWIPAGIPTLTNDVIIRANATIGSTCVAEANSITYEGSPTPTLTIADGGQLQTSSNVTATVKKNIEAYTIPETTDDEHKANGYYLISSPVFEASNPSSCGMITTASNYDLYQWDYSEVGEEWQNYKDPYVTFSIENGKGYLYANAAKVVLSFTGTVIANNSDKTVNLDYTTYGTSPTFNGWDLVGNPFVCTAYITLNGSSTEYPMAYYRMNAAGNGVEASTASIAPMEGIFVEAKTTGQSIQFSRNEPAKASGNGNLNINLAQTVTTRGAKGDTDNAIVRFDGGNTLGKFSFRENSARVYIPQDGKDYAVVSAESYGELPVNFKAAENGNYTLSFTTEDVEFSYLHLIDNMTGNEVDLLQTPSYNFDAQYTDIAARFKLVFAKGNADMGDDFGFIDANGNLLVLGIDGTATLQVVDVTGRVLSSETFSGNYSQHINAAAGVYMLRLIQGNDSRTQKIVVK